MSDIYKKIFDGAWRIIVKLSVIGLAVLLCLIALFVLVILYPHFLSKYNYIVLQSSLKNADEMCIITSYAVSTEDGNSFVIMKGRLIPIEWNISDPDDGVFIAILLKDGKTIKSLALTQPEAELVLDGQLLEGCKAIKH